MQVFKIVARIERGGNADMVSVVDVIIIEGQPRAVFAWEGDEPQHMVSLDPARIQWTKSAPIPGTDGVYQKNIKDPRMLS